MISRRTRKVRSTRPDLPATPRGRYAAAAGGAILLLLAVSACSSSSGTSDKASSSGSPSVTASGGSSAGAGQKKVSGTVVVFAAASLKETFTALGKDFQQAYPGTKVVLSFGGSDQLAASITGGAPADVFAAASPATMKTVTDKGDAAGKPSDFARNQLEIATLPGNPQQIRTLKDLTKSGLSVVLCAKTVPCGAAAQQALTASDLELTPKSYEQDVKSALTKVELKEADAAVVYRTDVNSAGSKVQGVNFPESSKAINAYPIAPLKDAPNPDGAAAFIALVKSAEGQKVLTQAGFLNP